MMNPEEFDNRLRHINDQHAARKEGAESYRDQELARLFHECEWGQERIAEHMKRKQQWVSLRLVFGRFLAFTTGCCNSQIQGITEGRFREHYKVACRQFPGKQRSDEKERQRFEHVLTGTTARPG